MILFFISGILAGGLRGAVCLLLIFRLLPVKENGGETGAARRIPGCFVTV